MSPKASDRSKSSPKSSSGNNHDFLVVGIGASAGGVKALQEFFAKMPPDSGMAFVVILHLSQTHKSSLADIIQRETEMPVGQVSGTVHIEPNNVYVIPPAKHLEISDHTINLKEPQRIKGVRVPIDRFLRTLADAYRRKAVCIILSGTGTDGTLGLKHIKGNNGFAIVQDPLDAEYDGMPRSAIETKVADVVLPVGEMPEKLLFVRDTTEKFRLTNGADGEVAKEIKNIEALRDVLALLRVRTGHDFSHYKQPTLIRRIARHLQIHETDDLGEYLNILREKPDEVLSLLKNLLINVTNFFRDKEAFAALEKKIIPALFEGKTGSDFVRVWVAGCSTGEEAYSIAILLCEYAATLPDPPRIQIFASDVDEDAIAEAREGRFTEAVVSDVSPNRLRDFFIKEDDAYRIRKNIREMILFAPHNILRDPPFSRLDLISCRNVLIYLNRETQEKVLRVFHFALREGGYLFLGSSETAESIPQDFAATDKKQRIYKFRRAATRWNAPPPMPSQGAWTPRQQASSPESRHQLQTFGELHHRLIEHYAPPSILINEEGNILHLSEHAGRFLRFTGGEPSANIMKVIHPALLSDLRSALFTARHEDKTVETKNIRVKMGGEEKFVNIAVRPVNMPDAAALVMFEESDTAPEPLGGEETMQAIIAGDKAMESVARRMEDELARVKTQLRTTIEQYETTVEELKASNEELQAINEELRSASEELETSKEELQSVNEEVTTINAELKEKIEEASRVNADLQNLVQSTDIATIFLDLDLRVKRFTPRTTEIFNVIASDIGRPIEHITHRLEPGDFLNDAKDVMKSLQTAEREVRMDGGRIFIARFSPYYTIDNRIDGVVMTFIDVTENKQAEEALRAADRHKDEFLATVAHELRNPLSPIRTGVEIMHRQLDNPETLEQTLRVVERQVWQMTRMLEDLLDISRIRQGKIKLRLERISLAAAVDLAIETTSDIIKKSGCELVIKVPDSAIYVDADVTRISQVIFNLLSNAVKYNKPCGSIFLEIGSEGGDAVINVRDTGQGIPAKDLSNIFKMFEQGEFSDEVAPAGIGVGLNIVKKLVEMHGGSVEARSEGKDKGSEFIVHLPLAGGQTAAAETREKSGKTTTAVSPKRILVVDDNADAVRMFQVLLTLGGHEVRPAFDGKSALEIADSFHPEAILLDIGMPDMDGYEVARRLRQKMPSVLLIAVSGWGQKEDRERSHEAGFDHHLIKPVEFDELHDLLNTGGKRAAS